jgi:hypothetical protein
MIGECHGESAFCDDCFEDADRDDTHQCNYSLNLVVIVELLRSMAATPVKRRARERSRVRKTPDADESDDIACSSRTFAPTVFTEGVTCQGGYLRHATVVPALHRQTNRYILLEHSDWVCKALSGKSRGRTPLRYAVTLCRLREIAAVRLQQPRRASALADDHLAFA